MARAFGIAASNDFDAVRRIAEEVERLGYSSFWTNDTPMADGLAVAARALDETSQIRVAIGVVAIDRRPPSEIARLVSGLDPGRFVLGIGAGFSARPVAAAIAAVEQLRHLIPGFRIGLAAMGPRMCRTAGEVADLILLNWMTSERVSWALERCAEGSRRRPAELPPLETATYVRAALGLNAGRLIAEEASHYLAMPHYKRHFDAMGADPESLGVRLDHQHAEAELERFEALLDEPVVRALPSSPADFDEILAIAQAGAPKKTS